MRRRWAAVVAWTSHREAGTSLALFRMLVAAVVLYSLLSVASAGLVDALWVDRAHGGMQRIRGNPLLRLIGGATPGNVWLLFGVALGSALALGTGLLGRASAFLLLQSYYALYTTNGLATGGYDMLISNALWLLVLGDSTATLSLDCRRRHGAWTSDDPVLAWPRHALIWQLVLLYFFTGVQKVSAPWTPGGGYTALYYVAHDPTWLRFASFWSDWMLFPSQVATAVTWHWEHSAILLPIVYHYRNTSERPGRVRAAVNRFDLRKPWAAVGVGMHVGILLLLNVGPFSLISLAYYVCLWRPDELEAALARIRRSSSGPP